MKPHKTAKGKARKKSNNRTREAGGSPTPIFVPPRVLALIVVVCVVAFALVLYRAPGILTISLGGTALAIVLSFPVRALSRLMPRPLAILVTFLVLIGLVILVFFFLAPPLIRQLRNFIQITPAIANNANNFLLGLIEPLHKQNILLVPPERVMEGLVSDLFDRARQLVENVLGGLVGFISGAFSFGITIFSILFVAVYLLADVRMVKAAYLKAAPTRYRRDARELWDAFGYSLSRYLGGLILVIVIQGVLSTVALQILDVPYAILLGSWVSATAIIPYLGPFLGAIPAIIIALIFKSPTIAFLTVLAYVLIQQFEGNFLTPRIQGNALHVHPIIVLLAVIGGGQLAGLPGVIFAVPTLAVVRVFFDFFRARLRAKPEAAEP